MRLLKAMTMLLIVLLLATDGAEAQSTTGTIRGHVSDAQGLALPGVTVTATSPSLQGELRTVTAENGDFLIPLLPGGTYVVSFELAGLERRDETVTLAPTQNLPLVVTLGLSAVREELQVVGKTADVLLGTTQVAANFKQSMIANLPNNRDINASLLLAPGVHATGPLGSYSFSGSMSFENLFLVNGVTINENIRGQAENLYVEDAIQETTIASAGVSAEYGRFGGGVVNVITKSGGNIFGGSFRETLHNDKWRALVKPRPGDTFTTDSKLDDVVPTHEYTFGGPALRDRLWFFTAGRLQRQAFNRQLTYTGIPYVYTQDTKRFEAKGTYALTAAHRFQGAFTKLLSEQINNVFPNSIDLNSLENRRAPEDLLTFNYSGALTSRLFVEARYSARNLTISGSGSPYRDIVKGTAIWDFVSASTRRFWSPTFCSNPECPPEERDNQDLFAKGTYFLSGRGPGSHTASFGVDAFNDHRFAQNYQTGSDYRIVMNNDPILVGAAVYPKFTAATQIVWRPIVIPTQGASFRTISGFVNDTWSMTPRLTANLGVRIDKNHGRNGAGDLVVTDAAVSPRLGLIWDAAGDQRWLISGSISKYVAGVLNTVADLSSAGGNPDQYNYDYQGPSINADTSQPLIPTDQALAMLFDWFQKNGGAGRPIVGTPAVRGVSIRTSDDLRSPNSWEYAAGVSRQFGQRVIWRNDFIYRNYNDFYAIRTDLSTGTVRDERPGAPPQLSDRRYDLAIVENSNVLDRQYAGLTSQLTYRPGARTDVGATYTLSRAWGNMDGESASAGAVPSDVLQYPEFRQESWNYPTGDLSIDQRHRARLWVNYGVPRVSGLITSVMQTLESGVPYGATAFSGIDPGALPQGLGYQTPPMATQLQYYYTARDAFRTEGQVRTDWAAIYSRRISRSRAEVYGQVQVINIFNQAQLCGCGASVFSNGGAVQTQYIDASVRTAPAVATLQRFNPYTTIPVEGVNWVKGPAFGHANNRFAYTTPRMLRITFGVRF